ncbi:MAG TPA: S8 family peptidase [Clostridiales bacterium]|nr:S8 family peptidase [Clostridiales bacterium]
MALVRDRIINEDYADIIVRYNDVNDVLDAFGGSSFYKLNSFTAVVHIPVENITDQTILQFGYSAMPLCYGPISDSSIEASGVSRVRSLPNLNLLGEGVLIGIIDSGIDYSNPIFQYEDGTTRIASIWDQTIDSGKINQNTFYGTEYGREQINEALKSDTPYNIVPSKDELGHGTMVAGIAAGRDKPEDGFFGVAPAAELVIVKLKNAKEYLKEFFRIPKDAFCYQETDLISGVQYIREFSRRIGKPLVICLALGSSQGPHDGTGVLQSFLAIGSTTLGMITTIAGGNEGNSRRHFNGEIDDNIGYESVELNVGVDDKGFSMELWGDSPTTFSIDIQTPSGEFIPRITVRLDENREINFVFEDTIINIDYQMIESFSGDQLILMRFANPSPGIWRFRVYGVGDLAKRFNMWLPMQDFISNGTYYIRSSPYTTILSAGNTIRPITITAYNPENDSLFLDSSKGYTRTGHYKPDLAAPGVNVIGPTLQQSFVPFSGTSVAVAHTAGIAAMLLEWGVVRGKLPRMNSLNAKKLLIRGARRNVNLHYPNRDWGYGIIDVFGSFEAIVTDLAGL